MKKPQVEDHVVAPIPLGVYVDHERHTAIVLKNDDHGGVFYLTMSSGKITLEHVGRERFKDSFKLHLAAYPMRRAVRSYYTSLLDRDAQAQKVMKRALERL